MQKTILACVVMFATLTQAAAAVECNEHGAVVTLTDGTVFYLGSNCDAERKGGGSGYWFNAGSFLAVNIDGNSYRVIEEVDCLPFCESPL